MFLSMSGFSARMLTKTDVIIKFTGKNAHFTENFQRVFSFHLT